MSERRVWYFIVAWFVVGNSSDTQLAGRAAADCSSGAIQAAINAAGDGDVVAVPSCAAAWSSSVIVPNTKGITLVGAGAQNTVIDLRANRLELRTSESTKPVRVSGVTFVHSDAGSEAVRITGSGKNWRIDHNRFDDNRVEGLYAIRIGDNDPNGDSVTYGVIDHNEFINRNYATSIFVEWPHGKLDRIAPGDWIWSEPAERGTAQAVYVEDNVFSGTDRASQVIDARWGAKYVLRYNTITNPWISTHSGCTNLGREPLWVEIYHNRFRDDAAHYEGSQIELRSVSGVVFGNASSTDMLQYLITIDHERSYRNDCRGPYGARCDGAAPFDQNVGPHGYVCLGQPGWGPPQAPGMRAFTFAGLFAWDNRNNNVAADVTVAHDAGYTSDHLQQGREWFNGSDMTTGPLANRPRTCTVAPRRSVYISTDENPLHATIYVCTGPDRWTKHWQPYAYPHPLTIDPRAPQPPTKLRIVR